MNDALTGTNRIARPAGRRPARWNSPSRCRHRRRGVLLLVILALLAMFGLVAVAFVVLSGQAMRAATAMQRLDEYAQRPREDLDRALMEVVRGSNNPMSVIQWHNLLEDMYGNETFSDVMTAISPVMNGQLLEFQVDTARIPYPLSRVGCVLTFGFHTNGQAGPATGKSTRIVGYRVVSGAVMYQILPPEGVYAAEILRYGPIEYLVNGVPFAGPGFGYNPGHSDPSLPLLSLADPNGRPYALLPNPSVVADESRQYRRMLFGMDETPGTPDDVGPDGIRGTADDPFPNYLLPNEDYDAADYQNMLLAAQVLVPTQPGVPNSPMVVQTLPSLHRPELVDYWVNGQGAGGDPDLLRRIILRPMPADHPRFTGSNPAFNPITGPWDVDNDGDGVADSIWVDLGLPARSAPNGQMYKPLFAILCVDLDGRLNLNAHGNWAQADPAMNYYLPSSAMELSASQPYLYASGGGAPVDSVQLPRGLGYGPAEINLLPLFQAAGQGNYYPYLLGGIDPNPNGALAGVFGRYGEFFGWTTARAEPGLRALDDPSSFNHHPGYPRSYTDLSQPTPYKSPPDLKGMMTVGLGVEGGPRWAMQNRQWVDMSVDDPYELDLSAGRGRGLSDYAPLDNPFSPAELERVLRPFDRDAFTLPQRLVRLAPIFDAANAGAQPPNARFDQRLRMWVTTESWDLPTHVGVPLRALPSRLLQRMPEPLRRRPALTLAELLTGLNVPPEHWRKLFPPEMLAGLKMNLHRPFGDGRDNQTQAGLGRGVVDEPGRVQKTSNLCSLDQNYPGETLLDRVMQLDRNGGVVDAGMCDPTQGVDVNGDGQINEADRAMARQLVARYLYVLAMLLRDDEFDFPVQEQALQQDEALRRELTTRRIAQWAVNCVDFCDPDAIMTPFEYDTDPFTDADGDGDPWDVDGVIDNPQHQPPSTSADDSQPYRGLVWGCEAPELLITETLAFHDRRVVDSKWDPGQEEEKVRKDAGDTQDIDEDLDQGRIPQGSAFFELYCARSAADNNAPAELYTLDGGSGLWYLDLDRMAPAGPDGVAYPVWRMVISESALENRQNDVFTRLQQHPDTAALEPEQYVDEPNTTGRFSLLRAPQGDDAANVQIERIVWFAGTPPAQQHRDHERVYYRRSSTPPLLRPGQYAVVGPRPVTTIGAEKIADGQTADAQKVGKPSKHAIILDQTVLVTSVDGGTAGYPSGVIKPPLAIVVAAELPRKTIGGGAGWGANSPAAPLGIGISISEPLANNSSDPSWPGYYPEPDQNNEAAANMGGAYAGIITVDAYGDLAEHDESKGRFLDEPLDGRQGMPLGEEGLLSTGSTAVNGRPYKYVFLQRLANPLLPYDPIENPYRTVDWMGMDLTVFNGEDRHPAELPPPPDGPGGLWDPSDPNPEALQNVHFQCRQRGVRTPGYEMNLYAPLSDTPEETNNSAPDEIFFRHELRFGPQGPYGHSLGFLNRAFYAAGGGELWLQAPEQHKGDPLRPFPWLAWHNRPFVSQFELLLVPTSHPGRMLLEFQLAAQGSNPYANPRDPFAQLLNFFGSRGLSGNAAGEFHRVLQYVHVPSPFVGTELALDPLNAAQGYAPGDPAQLMHWFYPPFHRIARYREPGRVNLNTIYSPVVWLGVLNYFPDGQTGAYQGNGSQWRPWRWGELVASRRGFAVVEQPGDPPDRILAVDPQHLSPTCFGKPFRTFAGRDFVPPVGPSQTTLRPTREVEATLLRSESETVSGSSPEPLFDFCRDKPDCPIGEHNDPERNAVFRYQALQRLGNLVTTRSNVYAIWITVGYFEVYPVDPDPVHPDGWMLGQELGSDDGQVKRHRAFYLFDRSIPVGFVRGQDTNVDDAVLLRRYIE